MLLAWLYWNPPRELFTIPFIDRPVAIYGACFVVGFILAFFILSWIFKVKLLDNPHLRARDIADWRLILKHLQLSNAPSHPLYAVAQQLDVKRLNILDEKQKSVTLEAINVCKLSRSQLEALFPKALVTAKEQGLMLTDKLTWFVVLATIIGARLGHVFFYEWPYYKNNWLEIFKVWEGGLASHGGIIAILFAIFLYYRWILKSFPEISFVGLLDAIAVPSPLVAAFIRIGNFFNQEILGPPTTMPWGIVFGDAMDRGPLVPRHPIPLYEAGAYLCIFGLLFYLWKAHRASLRPGILSGLCLTLGFTFRFFIESLKTPSSLMIDESFLQMGQWLSLPFIALGLLLIFRGRHLEYGDSSQRC